MPCAHSEHLAICPAQRPSRACTYQPFTQKCAAFVNCPNGLDFDEVQLALDGRLGPPNSGRAQADFALLTGATEVTAYPVSASRFAHTHCVSLFLVRVHKLTAERLACTHVFSHVLYWVPRQGPRPTQRQHAPARRTSSHDRHARGRCSGKYIWCCCYAQCAVKDGVSRT